jgi:hypothetical protein
MQQARLRELADQYRRGKLPNVQSVAETLTREFGVDRTPEAVSNQACELGIELVEPGMALTTAARLLGYTPRNMVRQFIAPGLLRALPWTPLNNKGPTYRVMYADLVAFVWAHPWAYDLRAVAVEHPIHAEAEAAARRRPWLTVEQIARATGYSVGAVKNYLADGLVPTQRRHRGGPPQYVMAASRLPELREAVDQLRQRGNAQRSQSMQRRGWAW